MANNSILERIQQLPDPRQTSKCSHRFEDILFIALCGILSGADDWVAIELYAHEKRAWFQRFLSLPNGIPSHDTFNRLFALLDPERFHELFIHWVREVLLNNTQVTGVVAVDGKTQRGTRSASTAAIHTVNAWSTDRGVCLGQFKVDDKSNEITAVPKLLEKLVLKGCLVTADAMSCQKKIARQITQQEADYLLAVKRNQTALYQAIEDHFMAYWQSHPDDQPDDPAFDEQSGRTHGRHEHRRCWVAAFDHPAFEPWGINTITAVQYDRVNGQRCSSDLRYFISSRSMSAEEVISATRQHWEVENSLHWVLDVAFNEDHSRARRGYAAENLATARQMALNLLKQDTTTKAGIKNRRKRCGWSERYLEQILGLVS